MGAPLQKINDNQLIEAYMKAIESENIDQNFIELLKQELINRNLFIEKHSS